MNVDKAGNFGTYVNQELKPNKVQGEPFGQAVSQAAQERNALRKAESVAEAEPSADLQRDQAIIDATFGDVTFSAANEPLALTLKTAIEQINEVLAEDVGPRAIETSVESGADFTPEATAERIVSLSTALLERYAQANPDLEGTELVDQFVSVISGGIEQGFTEARDILTGLGVLEGDVATNVDRTYDLVQDGLRAFLETNGGTVVEESDGTEAPSA
ncbi:DUF5610 domain-containing protein [Pontibacter sp. JAM-7]|uniref:DUF5610 domain-containing protein n=1 Tax=Pontibacter sp. JAM-7 TaxID=3366581 RepID=UPI003AF63F75